MTTTDSLRAALRDLMDDVDQYSINRDVWERARAALAQPDPALSQRPECFEFALDFLGSPENDQLREYIEQLEARAALAQPEPEVAGLSDNQLDLIVIAIQALTPHQPDATTHNLHVVDRGREILRRSLARWGRSARCIHPAGHHRDAACRSIQSRSNESRLISMPTYTATAPDGTPIKGTLELIQGCAFAWTLTRDDNGTLLPDYYGETKIYWDTQETMEANGETIYLDENDREWAESELVLTEVGEDDIQR